VINTPKIARLLFEDLSPDEQVRFYWWMGKELQTEGDRPMNSASEWWLGKLKSGHVLPGAGWPDMLPIDDLTDDYIEAVKSKKSVRGNATAMGRFLETVGAVEKKRPSVKNREGRRRHYVFNDLGKCRVAFEWEYGLQDWPGAVAAVPTGQNGAQEGVSA